MRIRIFLGFLAYGVVVGLVSVWWWNSGADMPFLLNIPSVLVGDEVYALAIEYLGNPRSSQAHYTIPWLLRVPQIYAIVSVLLWGMVGLICQWVANTMSANRNREPENQAVRIQMT